MRKVTAEQRLKKREEKAAKTFNLKISQARAHFYTGLIVNTREEI